MIVLEIFISVVVILFFVGVVCGLKSIKKGRIDVWVTH